MKFVPDIQKEALPELQIYREGNIVKSTIKYPEPKRTEQEFEDDDREDL